MSHPYFKLRCCVCKSCLTTNNSTRRQLSKSVPFNRKRCLSCTDISLYCSGCETFLDFCKFGPAAKSYSNEFRLCLVCLYSRGSRDENESCSRYSPEYNNIHSPSRVDVSEFRSASPTLTSRYPSQTSTSPASRYPPQTSTSPASRYPSQTSTSPASRYPSQTSTSPA
eukprot:221903_1